jgi:hypothetical protein
MFIPRKEVIKSGTVWDLDVINQITYQGVPFIPGGSSSDELVKITAADTTAGYLGAKVAAGTGIQLTTTNPGANETLTIACTVVDLDVKVKVSANDTTAGFLNGKLVAGTGITFTENNDGGNETLTVTLGSHTHAASDITSGVLGTARLASTGTASASTYLRGDQAWSGLDAGHITTGTVPTARLATGTANNTTFLRGDQTWQTITGGVAGFIGSQNTAVPNNVFNASRLLVDASTADADAVIQPKGQGALLAQLPDNTATGGNKRGQYAIDLQLLRQANTNVASGAYSVIVGGRQNTANSSYATVLGGYQNAATNQYATIVGGFGNNAQGYSGTIVGGESAFIGSGSSYCGIFAGSGQALSNTNYSVAVGGNNNTISGGDHNAILGGSFNTISTGSNRNAIVGGFNNSIPFYGHKAVILGGEYAMAYQSNTAYLGTGGTGTGGSTGSHQVMWTVLGGISGSTITLLRDFQNSQKGFAIRQNTTVFMKLMLVSTSSNAVKTAVQKYEGAFKRDNGSTVSLLYWSSATVLQNSFTSAPVLNYALGSLNATNPTHDGVDFSVTNPEGLTARHTLYVEAVISTY